MYSRIKHAVNVVFTGVMFSAPIVAPLAGLPRIVSAQFMPMMNVYVCQTPVFYCSVIAPKGFMNGTLCTCGTMWGPVGGYSIDPAGVPNGPPLPRPQQPDRTPRPNPRPDQTARPDQTPDAADCHNGLGNCAGSYVNAAGQGDNLSGEWDNGQGQRRTLREVSPGTYRWKSPYAVPESQLTVTGSRGSGWMYVIWSDEVRARCHNIPTYERVPFAARVTESTIEFTVSQSSVEPNCLRYQIENHVSWTR